MIKIELDNLGNNIKKHRVSKNYSLKELAEEIDVSTSLLSQIERGKANPSLNTLKHISKKLDIPMFSLFTEDYNNSVMVVKRGDRIRITNGESSSKNYQLSYDLLSPDMKGDIQLCEMTLSGKQFNSDDFNLHKGEEVAVCILGRIELMLENETHILDTGDSVRIPKGTKHKWRNPGNNECSIIFAITPPTF
ncbi:XRE family transcriptional regulator [Anaerococcus porci]|uniref:helix-turn-helix domain-containing protein n=1 Tax=Anaerococcus porci TaxID=2652269 RepID=UPI002A75D978|nr:XRE family transcriptional regulator [Anaerococcus porci]MDY3006058.1 XRE family transcriptional regulator [Anaerococcus porci]